MLSRFYLFIGRMISNSLFEEISGDRMSPVGYQTLKVLFMLHIMTNIISIIIVIFGFDD